MKKTDHLLPEKVKKPVTLVWDEALLSEQMETNNLLREILDRLNEPKLTLVPYTVPPGKTWKDVK